MFRCCSRRRRECCWRRKTLFWCFWWVVEKEDDFEDIVVVVVLTKVGEVFGRRRVIYIERECKSESFFEKRNLLRVFYIQKNALLSLGFVTEKTLNYTNPK